MQRNYRTRKFSDSSQSKRSNIPYIRNKLNTYYQSIIATYMDFIQRIPVHDSLLYTGYGARLWAHLSLMLLRTKLQQPP